MSILDQLADYARLRTEQSKQLISAEEIKAKALSLSKSSFAFENAIKGGDISFYLRMQKSIAFQRHNC